MKKKTLDFLSRFILSVLISLTFTTCVIAYPSGAPVAKTGSPGDGSHCVSCHGGSAAMVTGWITSNIPAQGYTAGTTYTITATVSGSGKKGFEVSPQSATGTQLGVLTAGSNNHLVGGTKYVTQNTAGSSSGTTIYNFTWTAPASGTGSVKFYGAFCVGKSSTKLSTMVVDEYAVIPLSATASALPDLICAGQSVQLNVVQGGGSGTYTYSWTSIPSGFTSSIQNPVVSPSVSTQYIAHVSDGTNSIDAPANVTVNQPATTNAGNDTTCAYATTQVPLNGVATNYSSVLWTTSGSGTFSAANALTGNYYPSVDDKTALNVTLTLTAGTVTPCTTAASDARIIHFDFPTGVPDTQSPNISMVISPNPSHGQFTLRISGIDNKSVTVTVADITGRTMVQRVLEETATGRDQFDMSGSPKGLYLVKIQTNTESMVRKLVIE